ncbi:MAG: hypothetical protein K1Y02_21645 [Candidatus Hydrogenedentes bacterium]|nr:hypothetical protein [Candidatus Hydrogenedentota bacterium]
MKRRVYITVFVVMTTGALGVGYFFLFGKLFPFSPLIIGFSKHEMTNSVVYVQNGANFNDYARLDALIPGVEKFHQQRFTNKPKLFIFRDKASYFQRSLSKARFCAFYNGSVVIAPWALEEDRDGKISLDIYLTHELSHSIIFQNAGLWHAYTYPHWLLEGLATYSANQMGTSFYPSRDETYRLIAQGNFMPPNDFQTRREDAIKIDAEHRSPFFYSEFACMVDYLVERHGKDKLLAYVEGLFKDSDNARVFRAVYGVDFERFVAEFREMVSKGAPA